MNETSFFDEERNARLEANSKDSSLIASAKAFLLESIRAKYSYNFTWLSRPIIQYPQDIVGIQELIWLVRPDLVIETGIAHGGSLVLSASILAMLDYCDAVESAGVFNPLATKRRVLGIDIDIRKHNRAAIETHPMSHLIEMIEGSSISASVISTVSETAKQYKRVLVCLDSNHTHEHVLAELEAYAPLTTPDSYCCVFDTVVEDLPAEMFADRPWKPGNNPKTAVSEFLELIKTQGRKASDGATLEFDVDKQIESKLLLSVAPNGYLKRI